MKPQQDKFVKDKLLNEIFQEIADENGETDDTAYYEEKSIDYDQKLSKKKTIQRNRQRIIIALLIVLIILILFNPNEKTSDQETHDNKENMYSIPIANQIPTKENNEVLAKEEPMIKISESAPLSDTKIIPQESIESIETLEVQEPKTEREKAKSLLMQQMQN